MNDQVCDGRDRMENDGRASEPVLRFDVFYGVARLGNRSMLVGPDGSVTFGPTEPLTWIPEHPTYRTPQATGDETV